jgi:ATP-binding cassette subfamily F protein 3
MLLNAVIAEKHMGSKLLFRDLTFSLHENNKVGLIGRNGVGKSTLFGMLTGEDTDFMGTIEHKRDLKVVVTAQEHFLDEPISAVEYALQHVPNYYELKELLDASEKELEQDMDSIHIYTEALQTFTERNYYTVEDEVVEALRNFDIDIDAAYRPLSELSGGQKRFVELVKVTFSRAELILLDEPTNHLDYHGKAMFIRWLRGTKTAVCIVSHDRDVLKEVTSIVEIRDLQAYTYPGNYEAYIRQNGSATIAQISQYKATLRRLEILHDQIQTVRARKGAASDSRPKILEERLQREYDALKESLQKPSFWIDQDTTAELGKGIHEDYKKYKARNIAVQAKNTDKHSHELLAVKNLSVGYVHSLFSGLGFTLSHGDRLQIRGRNGAGKSTLLKAVLAQLSGEKVEATVFEGEIKGSGRLRIGLYEQEISRQYLPMPLGKAIEEVYHAVGLPLTQQALKGLMATYLFDPMIDGQLEVQKLSGGQKARFQLIRMLCGEPNLLILDEPTNHLDLPSIEELENALSRYSGALLYVSHDSYFITKMAGEVVQVGKE